MTRKEAKSNARKISYRNDTKESLFFQQQYVNLVNKIYDDFENKHCAQCNQYINHGFGWVECDVIAKGCVVDIDYCSKFERKDNE